MAALSPKVLGYGLLTWVIPFVCSMPLMSPEGVPKVDPALFKALMTVVSVSFGSWALQRVLLRSAQVAQGSALALGLGWMAINLLLDLVVLVAIFGMPLQRWLWTVALVYVCIPVMAWAMGRVRDGGRLGVDPQ